MRAKAGYNYLHGGQHLPPVSCQLLELLVHLKLALSRLHEALGLHGPLLPLLAEGDERLAAVAQLPEIFSII